jgi:hypothetical protein
MVMPRAFQPLGGQRGAALDVVHHGLARAAGPRPFDEDVALAPVEKREEIRHVVGGYD